MKLQTVAETAAAEGDGQEEMLRFQRDSLRMLTRRPSRVTLSFLKVSWNLRVLTVIPLQNKIGINRRVRFM